MHNTIPEGLAGMEALYRDQNTGLHWPYVFSLPGWMTAWWRWFGAGYEPTIITIRDRGRMLGVAPFKCREKTASFIGDASVCDYLDFIVVPGREEEFSEVLLRECMTRGITKLELGTLRPDSVGARYILPFAQSRGLNTDLGETDVSFEASLPTSFDAYLANLPPQERREIGRKQRKMDVLGRSTFRMLEGGEVTDWDLEVFLGLMAESRRDKADFLTAEMRSFFHDMTHAMASGGFLCLGFLDVGKKTVAGVLGFNYNDTFSLYNSGYDPSYAELGVGLLSKLAAIRWAIERGKTVFDFLKGSEVYKERLGGRRVGLASVRLALG